MSNMGDLDDLPDTFPMDGFTLFGIDCLDEKCIMGATFVRDAKEGNGLDVNYAITDGNKNIISAPFERFASDEAYLALYDSEGKKRSTLTLMDLRLDHMELVTDEADDDAMFVILSYKVGDFTQA